MSAVVGRAGGAEPAGICQTVAGGHLPGTCTCAVLTILAHRRTSSCPSLDPHLPTSANCARRGHLGGIAGGAAVAWLLGPRYEFCRILGMPGVWVVDDPPVQVPAPGEWTTRPKRIM